MDHLHFIIMDTMQHHRGKANAISRKALLDRLHFYAIFPEDRLTDLDRDMREVISEDGSGICSCSKGYYIAADTAEAKQAVRYLDSYIIALARRKRSLLKAYPDAAEGVQGELGL